MQEAGRCHDVKREIVDKNTREVRVIGVTGCSASGKSTVAHQLADALRSPLFPLTIDAFFDGPRCEEWGTFEDYRLIRFTDFAHAVHTAVGVFAQSPPSQWAAELQRLAPELGPFIRPSPSPSPRSLLPCDAPQAVAAENESTAHAVTTDGIVMPDEESDADSFQAHEAEDAARRNTALPLTVPTSSSTCACSAASSPPSVVYIVCEGFVLFCDATLTRHVFDVCVNVQCDLETACVRRFKRQPRRHRMTTSTATAGGGGGSMYRARIQRLWDSRTEPRRTGLLRTLQDAAKGVSDHHWKSLQSSSSSLPELTGDMVAGAKRAQQQIEATARTLLDPSLYYPPRSYHGAATAARVCTSGGETASPRPSHNDAVLRETVSDADRELWDDVTGQPTHWFIQFWKHYGSTQASDHRVSDASAQNSDSYVASGEAVTGVARWAVMTEETEGGPWRYARDALGLPSLPLTGKEPQMTTATTARGGGVDDGDDDGEGPSRRTENGADLLWRRYAEFRYWFVFEVFFFHELFRPLQEAHVQSAIAHRKRVDRDERGRRSEVLSLTVRNGREQTTEQVQHAVCDVAETIMQHTMRTLH